MGLTEQPTRRRPLPAAGSWVRSLVPATGPQRAISLATFVNTFGSGMFMTSSALFFTQIVGLSMSGYTTGLLVGSMAGLVVGLFAGRLADQAGARETQIAVKLSGAVAMVACLFVGDFWQWVLVSSLIGVTTNAHGPCQAPLIRAYGGENPVRFRAYQRSLTNLSLALGALVAGVAIGIGTRSAYDALLWIRAALYVGCALALLRVPRLVPARGSGPARRWQALRDRQYLTATAFNSLMSVHFAVPTVLLPLWIADRTHAPRSIVSGAFILNTVLIVLLQVRASKGVDDNRSAAQRMLWAGIAIAGGLTLVALAAGMPSGVAVALVLGGVVVYTLGELWHAAASMEYQFGLAPAEAQGQYSGVFGLGQGLATSLAPAIVGVGLSIGVGGVIGLGLAFLVVGALTRPLIALTLRDAPA
ncbi:MFS transporter [Actinomadura sp. DC4]|uniref:MFS transporter n=1 Tax=Actinomadura sp. DC4 TaxID=3055069 RepID=UPI0025B07CFE|nr:MFS transporter [Actinomadura sp. DC4]MDN3354833.1 MFS transporter [Actinomadura sp. DC4]